MSERRVVAILLATAVSATAGAEKPASGGKERRLVTRHKTSFVMMRPKRYLEEVARVPGVAAVSCFSWFGGEVHDRPGTLISAIATDPDTLLAVYPEISVEPGQRASWTKDRKGALVGKSLAAKHGWKVGDTIKVDGQLYPGTWDFAVSGVFTTDSPVDDKTLWIHWSYLDGSPSVRRKDQVGWLVSRIDDPSRAEAIARAIDDGFAGKDAQTYTMSEEAFDEALRASSASGSWDPLESTCRHASLSIL